MQVTGRLVSLAASDPSAISAGVVAAPEGGGASGSVRRAVDDAQADVIFDLRTEPALRVGYGGVYVCT